MDETITQLEKRVRILELVIFLGTELMIHTAEEKAQIEYAALVHYLLPSDSRKLPDLSPEGQFPVLASLIKSRGYALDSFFNTSY